MLTAAMKSCLSLLLLIAAPAAAQATGDAPQSYRLSQAEIDATVAAASYRAESAALLPTRQVPAAPLALPHLPPAGDLPLVSDRKPHGVAGFAVDSQGGYALFSSTAVPIGEESYASFSFSYSRMPGYNLGPYGGNYSLYDSQLPIRQRDRF